MRTVDKITTLILLGSLAVGCSGGGGASSVTGPGPGPNPMRPSSLAGMIVFSRGSSSTLMAMNTDGSGIVSLGVSGWHASVSPDGRKLAYSNPAEGISVLDLATGSTSVVASERLSVAPRWSPDGSKILFWSSRTGTQELYTMNPNGSGVVRLSDGGGGFLEGHLSPDGTRIVFRRVQNDAGDIWVMNADGTDAAPLYVGSGQQSVPRWSPDGNRVAFISSRFQGSTVLSSDVYVMNADGSNVRRVTDGATENWWVSWSPDGSRIAFFRIGAGHSQDLFTIRADGSDLSPLLVSSTDDSGPEYGPAR